MDLLRERLKELERRINELSDLGLDNPFAKTVSGESVIGKYRRLCQERDSLKAAIDSRGRTYRRRKGFLKRY